MDRLDNPYRGRTGAFPGLVDIPYPSIAAPEALELIARCPVAAQTPLLTQSALAEQCGVRRVSIKDERNRMGLGSFKALGAAYVVAHDAAHEDVSTVTYVTASAGNHGLSVAAGAAAFGARAVVYIAETVPESFADRLRAQGAEVRREGAIYEDSMAAAARAAKDENMRLLSDSSWHGYTERPHRLMEGYLVLMAEAVEQLSTPPSHIFVQAGVGGLAGAVAAMARAAWGSTPRITVVEPEVAQCLKGSIAAGEARQMPGPVSAMGRLDCKEPSLIALKGLAHDADDFLAISEADGRAGAELASELGLASSPSGAAGLAGLLVATRNADVFDLDEKSHVMLILSEGDTA
ncbi:MAG: pyridoxal-phosphate dependent enzyme [Arenibacterium sp.]